MKNYLLITNPKEYGEIYSNLAKLKKAIKTNKTNYLDIMVYETDDREDELQNYIGDLDLKTFKVRR